jgi:hypothetical protein
MRRFIIFSIFSVCAHANAAYSGADKANNQLLVNPHPWCVGRFVINRPAQSEMANESYEYWGDKIDINLNVRPGTFQHKIQAREAELHGKKRTINLPLTNEMLRNRDNGIRETSASWLEKTASPTNSSRILIYNEFGGGPAKDLFEQEGYVLVGTTMLIMKSRLRRSDIDKSIRLTSDEYQHITYRDSWAVPTEPGFCINGALIGGPSRNSEALIQAWTIPGAGSIVIDMRDAVDVDEQFSLLKNLSDLKHQLRDDGYSGHVKILRQGKRTVASMETEEVLFSIKADGVQLFRFYLLAPGKAKDVAHPHASIQLRLGEIPKEGVITAAEATSPVDEAGAIQVWDELLDSMSLRPGAI